MICHLGRTESHEEHLHIKFERMDEVKNVRMSGMSRTRRMWAFLEALLVTLRFSSVFLSVSSFFFGFLSVFKKFARNSNRLLCFIITQPGYLKYLRDGEKKISLALFFSCHFKKNTNIAVLYCCHLCGILIYVDDYVK